MAQYPQSEFAPAHLEVEIACAAFRDAPGPNGTKGPYTWPGTHPMAYALEAVNRARANAPAAGKGFVLYAPGAGYSTGRENLVGGTRYVWGSLLANARVYPTFEAVVSALVTGHGDHMIGLEVRRVTVSVSAPAPVRTVTDEGAVQL